MSHFSATSKIDEALQDPLTRLLMTADRVDKAALATMLRSVAAVRATHPRPARLSPISLSFSIGRVFRRLVRQQNPASGLGSCSRLCGAQ